MILRDRPSGLNLFLALRGSVLPRILPALVVNIAIATLVTWTCSTPSAAPLKSTCVRRCATRLCRRRWRPSIIA